jgi:hypothetical protein
MFNGLSAIRIEDLFERVVVSRAQGHSLKLKKHGCHLDLRRYFFSERVINHWNSLDADIVLVNSLNGFKNKLVKLKGRGQASLWTCKASSGITFLPGVAAPGN